jgi:hypothetical protein
VEIITGLGNLILGIAAEVIEWIKAISTPDAVLIGFWALILFLRGWEKRLSKQLLWLLQPEKAAQWAREEREFKAWQREERRRDRSLGPGDMQLFGIVIRRKQRNTSAPLQ